MNTKISLPAIVSIAVLVSIDQVTKYLVRSHLSIGEMIPVTSFFNITYVTNTGVAFSMFRSLKGANLFFIFFTIIVLGSLLVWYIRQNNAFSAGIKGGLLLVAAGALGNLIDRIAYGHVIDFLELYYRRFSWPVFNVADSCITIGGTLLMLSMLLQREPSTTV